MNIRVTAVLWILYNCQFLRKEHRPTWAVCTIANKEYYIRRSYVLGDADKQGVVRIAPVRGDGSSGDWVTEELAAWSNKQLDQLLQEIKPDFDMEAWQFQQELQE